MVVFVDILFFIVLGAITLFMGALFLMLATKIFITKKHYTSYPFDIPDNVYSKILLVAKKLGKTSVVVPIKSLQEQYTSDYTGKKYVLKGENKLKIAPILGRQNFKCRFLEEFGGDKLDLSRYYEKNAKLSEIFESMEKPKISQKDKSCDNNFLPCKIEIKEKNMPAIKDYLKQNPGVSNVEVSIKPGASKLIFTPNSQEILQAGLSIDQVGVWSRLYLSGLQLDKVKINDQEYPVNLRFNRGNVPADDLSSFSVLNSQSQVVPFLSLGELSLAQNPTSITHLDTKRSISISASVLPGFNRVDLGKQLEKYAQSDLNLATSYNWSTGGVNEENQKSVNSIFQSMVLSALLILATMVIELGSFRKAIIVMLVIPLAVSGVFIVFAISGTPLSFPALIGIMALFGIVVKNAIMMIDKINLNLEAGIEFKEAIAEGAASRLEPIMFSSLTNIIGLIPITISDPLWRGLGGAIISGLIFSGSIMLLFIPVIYDWWMGKDGAKAR